LDQITLHWTRDKTEVGNAKKFRFEIFSNSFNSSFPFSQNAVDADSYDEVSDHLIAKDMHSDEIIACYRVIPREARAHLGKFYCESLFDISPIKYLGDQILEVDRFCMHKNYRNGFLILALWREIFNYFYQNNYSAMIGCSSVSFLDGGDLASSIYKKLLETGGCFDPIRCTPKFPVNLNFKNYDPNVKIPSLFRAYLNLGAQICGKPSIDAVLNTADFLTILRKEDVNQRYLNKLIKT